MAMKLLKCFETDPNARLLKAGDRLECEHIVASDEYMVLAHPTRGHDLTIVPLNEDRNINMMWFSDKTTAGEIPEMYNHIYSCKHISPEVAEPVLQAPVLLARIGSTSVYAIVHDRTLNNWIFMNLTYGKALKTCNAYSNVCTRNIVERLIEQPDCYATFDLNVNW